MLLRLRAADHIRLMTWAAGGLVLLITRLTGINYNFLYLLIAFSLFGTATIAVTRPRVAVAAVALLALLLWFPRKIPAPTEIDPAPVDDTQMFTATIPQGVEWRYHFDVSALPNHRDCGDMTPTLYADGDRLKDATVSVRLEGTSAKTPFVFTRSNGLDNIVIAPVVDGIREFTLVLTAKPDQKPAIRIGPETNGTQVFSDSVYLEVKNAQCTIQIQTLRAAGPITAAN
jgi:hypothetical protein